MEGAFYRLRELGEDERFFTALLKCVEEARLAGLNEEHTLSRARELLRTGSDAVTREAYEDFWNLLNIYEGKMAQAGSHDYPSLVREALKGGQDEGTYFFLGFDQLSLLETDLCRELAKENAVYLPLALSQKELELGVRGPADHTAQVFLRALLTGFTGKITIFPGEEDKKIKPVYLLDGHVPSEEVRSAAVYGRYALDRKQKVRYLLPKGELPAAIFQEELGLPKDFAGGKILDHPLARIFFHAIEIKEKQYELTHGLELAQLLQFTQGKFFRLAELASRVGVRKGLWDWQRKAKETGAAELLEFSAFLEKLDCLIPTRAPAAAFAEAVTSLAELCGLGELARRAPDRPTERAAHGALASMVRYAQLLGASVKGVFSFQEWFQEWSALLAEAKSEPVASFSSVQFYSYGEWLPPEPESITVALRWDNNVAPRNNFHFYLEEAARRKLSDLQLLSQVQEELTFLDQMERIARLPGAVFSWSKHDGMGKEVEPSWMAAVLPMVPGQWPEIARTSFFTGKFKAQDRIETSSPEIAAFNASLLEAYKECPFKAFTQKILRIEDRILAGSLDLGHLESGSLVHRTLELYYGEHKGKTCGAEEREPLLERCLQQAVTEQNFEYFKGNEGLLQAQVARLKRLLLRFLEMDSENYKEFPAWGEPQVEVQVQGKLGPFQWKGKIDRIDLDPKNRNFLVVDYKAGASTPKSSEIQNLERFQLQLYMDAAQELHPDHSPVGGVYVSLRTGERNQGLLRKEFNGAKNPVSYYNFSSRTGALKSEEEFAELREKSRKEALALAEKIQGGQFPVQPLSSSDCQRCEVRPACRIRELEAPAPLPWPRALPDFSFLHSVDEAANSQRTAKGFNQEQTEALERKGFVFIEASAGTGKTTVIVEKIRLFLAERLAQGDLPHQAVERFSAISFTDKSAQELASRVGAALVADNTMGPRLAAQAIRQIGTIHGFCRRILSDFPLEAGISPMAELLDERQTETLREEVFEEFFLHPPVAAQKALQELFVFFPRKKIENLLRQILGKRLLFQKELAQYRAWASGEIEKPGDFAAPGGERFPLGLVIQLSDAFQDFFTIAKRQREVLDFNDLESLALQVLDLPQVQEFYRERFSLLLVDEFQDTNTVQREILEKIARPGWSNLFVVGDAKQSIYRFRAADVSVFQGLRQEAERSGNLVTLFRNYRSRKELVQAANQITETIFPAAGSNAPGFEAVAALSEGMQEDGGCITLMEYEPQGSAEEIRKTEAELVVQAVQAQLAKGRSPSSIAILLRKISSNQAYLSALTRAGIPFRLSSSKGFYSQTVILDGLALLRALYGAGNDLALLAVLRSPWVGLSDNKILEIKKRGHSSLWKNLQEAEAPRIFSWKKKATFSSFSEILQEAYSFYPLDRRAHLQTVKLLSIISAMEKESATRVQILDRLSLWAGWEMEEEAMDDSTMPEPGSGGSVEVMTIHSAKGLEFDVTILPDLSSKASVDRSALRMVAGLGIALKLEEEENSAAFTELGEKDRERELAESKRLLYVATTRAKEESIFILPKALETKKGKRESWADFLRQAKLESIAGKKLPIKEQVEKASVPSMEYGSLHVPLRLETSITELAALQFCPEFHRRKFVQKWDDRVVALWPQEKKVHRKKDLSPEQERAKKILKTLGIENKERGIALHRVLERNQDLALSELWLEEAYEAQGVDVSHEAFKELIAMDLALLRNFLASDLGKELFSSEVEAHAELPFQWKVGTSLLHGTMDRLIRRPDGTWVVVDYKSSISDDSQERYRFQVRSYMAAVFQFAQSIGEQNPKVLGYLVDLHHSKSYPVAGDPKEHTDFIEAELRRLQKNYTLTDEEVSISLQQIQGGDHCFSCPYSLHCDLGRKLVLAF